MSAHLVLFQCDRQSILGHVDGGFLRAGAGVANGVVLQYHVLGRTLERKAIAAVLRTVVLHHIVAENAAVWGILGFLVAQVHSVEGVGIDVIVLEYNVCVLVARTNAVPAVVVKLVVFHQTVSYSPADKQAIGLIVVTVVSLYNRVG